MMPIETNDCPSHFALDDRELHGGGDPAVRRHIADCRRCQARIAERAADGASFAALSDPLWTRIAARGQERRLRRRRLLFVQLQLPALAVGLGAVALLAVARAPGDGPKVSAPYVGPKGIAPVEITRRRGSAIVPLAPGDDVMPGDQLRFRPRPVWPDARFIQIGSVDGTGRYTTFYPPEAGQPSVPLPAPGQALDGSIVLDAAPGPERLFVVLSAAPLSEIGVRKAAEGAAAATSIDKIDGVPVSAYWIVLPKRAGAVNAP